MQRETQVAVDGEEVALASRRPLAIYHGLTDKSTQWNDLVEKSQMNDNPRASDSGEKQSSAPDFDLDSAWDDVLLLEERAVSRGLREGLQEGRRRGHEEGFALGVDKGAEIGGEIGFYLGFASSWTTIIEDRVNSARLEAEDESAAAAATRKEQKRDERALKALGKLAAGAADFPRDNIKEEDVADRLQGIRARFKFCCQVLEIKAELSPHDPASISW